MGTYYKECFLEDIYHFDALDVLKDLEPGKVVELDYDESNATYRNRILVRWSKNKESAETLKTLGVLSEEDSKSMLPFFKNDWGKEVFMGKICFVDKETEIQRIKIVVYIKKK